MNKYLKQKANLENQGWRVNQKIGAAVYFVKTGISGIIVEVDACTGRTKIHRGAPPYFVEKHAPIINRIKQLRLEKGLTQQELADLVGISLSLIQKYEQDDYDRDKASALTIQNLANVFGTTVGDLLD